MYVLYIYSNTWQLRAALPAPYYKSLDKNLLYEVKYFYLSKSAHFYKVPKVR